MVIELPEELDNESITALELPDHLTEILAQNQILTLSHVSQHLNDKTLTEIPLIGPSRRRTIEHQLLRYIRSSSSNFWQIVLSIPQIIYYFCVLLLITTSLYFSVNRDKGGRFDQDEISVILIITLTMIAFDCGRWVSRPRSEQIPYGASILRAFLVFIASAIVLAFGTKNKWELQEGLRMFMIGLSFGIVQSLMVFVDSKWFPTENIEHVPDEETSVFEKIIQKFKSCSPEVKAAIIGGVFLVLSVMLKFLGDLTHSLFQTFVLNS